MFLLANMQVEQKILSKVQFFKNNMLPNSLMKN